MTVVAMKPSASSAPAVTLRQRVADALTKDTTSAELRSCIAHTQADFERVERELVRAKGRAVDPLSSEEDAAQAKRDCESLHFDRERLEASDKRLSARLERVLEQEEQARRTARYDAALTARDEMLAEVTDRYPKLAGELVDLFERMIAVERNCHAANQMLPAGADRLEFVEQKLQAHLARSSYPGVASQIVPLYNALQLPKLQRTGNDDFLKLYMSSWSLPL